VTITALLRRLAAEFGELAREDLALAKVEMAGKLRMLAIGVALLVVALLLSVGILATLTTVFILALALVVKPWLAALIVTAAYAVIALVAVLVARANIVRALPPIPNEAIELFKENLQWAKALATSNKI